MQKQRVEYKKTSQDIQKTFIPLKETEKAPKIVSDATEQPQETDLQDSIVEIKYLANSWLDDFEKHVFNGKTVNELLNQKDYE